MTTKEIAERLVALCRKGEFEAAHRELFSAEAVNIEPYASPDFPQETKGLAATHRASARSPRLQGGT